MFKQYLNLSILILIHNNKGRNKGGGRVTISGGNQAKKSGRERREQ